MSQPERIVQSAAWAVLTRPSSLLWVDGDAPELRCHAEADSGDRAGALMREVLVWVPNGAGV